MSASSLHSILGEGDDNSWSALSEHSHSFLFAAIEDQQVVSLHELQWDRRKPRVFASGLTGWVRCRQNAAAGEPLSLTYRCRVHVCRQCPCTAMWPPSKYGDVPPPARHGRVVRLCDAAEILSIEAAWNRLLDDIRPARPDDDEGVTPALDAPLASTFVGAMSAPTSAVADGAPTGSQLQGLQDEVISAANLVGARAEAEPGMTSALDAHAPATLVDAVSKPTSAVAERLCTSILARADEISVAGAWIGVFEIMAWCAMNKQRVVVQLEEGTVDPIADLAPRLLDKTWSRQPLAGRLVVCRMDAGVWHVASWRTCTHYVAAKPLQGEMSLQGVGVVAHMGRLGYATMLTETNGDCGIECFLLLTGSRRGPAQRIALRRRLQEFLQAASHSPVWHDAYIAAGEVPQQPSTDIRDGGALLQDMRTLTNDEEPQQPQADICDGGALTLPDGSMTQTQSIVPCNDRASATGPIVMADGAKEGLRAAILWAVGLDKPTDGFIKRLAASLTVDEAEQLVQAHIRGDGAIVQHRSTNKAERLGIGKRRRRKVSLPYKKALAMAYTEWAKERNFEVVGKATHGAMTQFLEECALGSMTRSEMQNQRMLLRRSLRQMNEGQLKCLAAEPMQKRVKRYTERCRVKSLAGRSVKAGMVREELYDWFCLIKRSVKGRIPPAFVLQKASTLVEEYCRVCLRQGKQANAPALSYAWLRNWRLEFGVCFRKPNRKWKVPASILSERLRITWENVYRVRQLAIRVLGYDPDQDNLDQSPFHMNEAGSKAEKSMSLRGCANMPLKEGHAQTRERWTLQTTTTSNPERARGLPPVEIMFKASGDTLIRSLTAIVPAWAPWLTVVTAPKGSYREDDVLNFIEQRLEPMTEGRRWRILLLDAYSAHLTERVRRCAWHKGYVVITHGGGASSICQTNDTDLHAHLKRLYIEMEMADALEQMRLKPWGVPIPRRSDVIGWVCCMWSSQELHLRASGGFLKVGLSNALDGSQDAEICREAGEFWHREGMRRRRLQVIHDVDVEVDAGRLTWRYADVYKVISPFPVHGKRWDNEPADKGSESSAAGDTDSDIRGDGEDSDDPGGDLDADPDIRGGGDDAQLPLALAQEGSLRPDVEALLQSSRAKLASMGVVLQQVQAIGSLSLEAQVEKAIHIEQKKIRILSREHPEVSKLFLDAQDAEERQMRKDMISIRNSFAEDKQRKDAIKDLLEQQDKLRERKLELLRASTLVECAKALKSWDLDDLGQGHASGGSRAHAKNRVAILERVRARSKPLPPDLANDWSWFLKHWDAARVAMLHPWQKDGWARDFLGIVKDLVSKLREDEDALAKWMRRERRKYLTAPALCL